MTDGPVSTCSKHGEYNLHAGCIRCEEEEIATWNYPVTTLDGAREAATKLRLKYRNAETTTQRVLFGDALRVLNRRWPGLRGGIDEVKVSGR